MNNTEEARPGVDDASPWTLTFTGKKFYYLNPTLEMIDIEDILHCLGNLCRFTGATKFFYSIAQHSVLVMALVKRKLDALGVDRDRDYWDQILAALLHDSEETYVNDLASPLKSAIRGKYRWIANAIRLKVLDKLDIDRAYMNQMVKDADTDALEIERFYLMPAHPDWPGVSQADIDRLDVLPPKFQSPHEATEIMRRVLNECLKHRAAVTE